jgi:transcriptional regulator
LVARGESDILRGTLGLLILKTLSRGPLHGYGITLEIQELTKDVLRIEEGSLYPALHRMERDGWIRADWKRSENNRRARYYELTKKGRKRLEEEAKHWVQLTKAVSQVLQIAGTEEQPAVPGNLGAAGEFGAMTMVQVDVRRRA